MSSHHRPRPKPWEPTNRCSGALPAESGQPKIAEGRRRERRRDNENKRGTRPQAPDSAVAVMDFPGAVTCPMWHRRASAPTIADARARFVPARPTPMRSALLRAVLTSTVGIPLEEKTRARAEHAPLPLCTTSMHTRRAVRPDDCDLGPLLVVTPAARGDFYFRALSALSDRPRSFSAEKNVWRRGCQSLS